jgi:hypothetical protein
MSTTPHAYVIHLDLDEFLAALTSDGVCDHAYLQTSRIPERVGGIPLADTLRVVLTAPVSTTLPTGDLRWTIHALRLTLETLPVTLRDADQQALDAAANDRANTIHGYLRQELMARGVTPRTGIMLVPGLRKDLDAYDGAQGHWRIVAAERGNPHSRRLEWR